MGGWVWVWVWCVCVCVCVCVVSYILVMDAHIESFWLLSASHTCVNTHTASHTLHTNSLCSEENVFKTFEFGTRVCLTQTNLSSNSNVQM